MKIRQQDVIIVIVGLLLIATNPSQQDHYKAVREIAVNEVQSKISSIKTKESSVLSNTHIQAERITDTILNNQVGIDNGLLFSLTNFNYMLSGKTRVGIGILGRVYPDFLGVKKFIDYRYDQLFKENTNSIVDKTKPEVIKTDAPDFAHQYWLVDKEAGIFGLMKLDQDNSYTHVIQGPNNFKTSGSGNWLVAGNKIKFKRSHGVCFEGEADIKSNDDGKFWIILPNGRKIYVQDDDGYYIKNSIPTPASSESASKLPYDKKLADEYDRKHSCSDQDAFDLGYGLARDQIGSGLLADADYLYKLTDRTANYYCFSRGVDQFIKDKR